MPLHSIVLKGLPVQRVRKTGLVNFRYGSAFDSAQMAIMKESPIVANKTIMEKQAVQSGLSYVFQVWYLRLAPAKTLGQNRKNTEHQGCFKRFIGSILKIVVSKLVAGIG